MTGFSLGIPANPEPKAIAAALSTEWLKPAKA
jgi:hypothetical protein